MQAALQLISHMIVCFVLRWYGSSSRSDDDVIQMYLSGTGGHMVD